MMKTRKKDTKIQYFFQNPVYWIYLCLFLVITGYGFYRIVLAEGSSNLTGVANYSVLALFALIPLLSVGTMNYSQTVNERTSLVSHLLRTVIGVLTGLLIYIPFGAAVSVFGVFRWGLFLNILLNISLLGISIAAINVFIVSIFRKRVWAFVCAYGVTAVIAAVEISHDMIQEQPMYRILYNFSLSKYTFGLNVGIMDWKAILMFICVAVLFTLFIVIIDKSRQEKQTAVKNFNKKAIIISAVIIQAILIFLLITPSSRVYGLDMTPIRFFTPGTYAEEYIETVHKDVTIIVLEPKQEFIEKRDYSTYFLQAERILEGLAKNSDNINLEYRDIQKDDSFLIEYDSENPSIGDILITCGEQYQLIHSEELFNFIYPYDQEGNMYMQISSSKVEQEICSAIDAVISEENEQIVFFLGRNEHENYMELAGFLEEKGYQVSFSDIDKNEVPDAKLAVVFAPSEDYEDTTILEDFLYNDGRYSRNLLYVANSDTNNILPNLDSFLDKWGITVENYTIMETDEESYTNADSMYGLNEYIDASFISGLEYLERPAVVPYSRNISIDEEVSSLYYRVLLQSKDTSCLINQNTLIDELDNYITAVIASYYQATAFGDTYTGISGHVAVIGSEYAFASNVLKNSEYSNSEYFLDAATELTGKNEVRIPIADKGLDLGAVEMSDTIRVILMILFIVFLPGCALAAVGLLNIKKNSAKINYKNNIMRQKI